MNLIRERIVEMTAPRTIGGTIGMLLKMLTKQPAEETIGIRLQLPQYDYFLADVFIEDIEELSNKIITVPQLIGLLLQDFADQARVGMDLVELGAHVTARKRFMSQERNNRGQVMRPEPGFIFDVPILKKSARRVQVLLKVLEEQRDVQVTLEEMATILITDLVEQMKKGDSQKWAKAIVDRLQV